MVEIRREDCGEVALTCFSSFDTGFGLNPDALEIVAAVYDRRTFSCNPRLRRP